MERDILDVMDRLIKDQLNAGAKYINLSLI
jgi:hypothetical protein